MFKYERSAFCHRSEGVAVATSCAVAIAMAGARQREQSELRFRILRELASRPEASQRQLADHLGVSLGRLNYCLHALVEKGMVKLGNFRASDDKRRYLYLLTPSGMAEKAALTGQFLARKMQEHAELTAEIEGLRAEINGENDAADWDRQRGHDV